MIRILFKAVFTRGNWKFAGRTNKTVSNYERMMIASASLIGSIVTLLTLGNITFWGDIIVGLAAGLDRKKNKS